MNGILIVPSLNRPHLLKRLLKSYKDTEAEVPGLILIDKRDFSNRPVDYGALELPANWRIVKTDGVTMGDKCREAWDLYKDLDFTMLCNDDHILETKHWDKLIEAQVRGHNIIGTNDGWQAPRRLAGMTCWSGKVLRTIGWMFPPGLHHLYIDSIWENLGAKTGAIQILMDVMVRHDHAFNGGEKDQTHHKVYPEGWADPTHENGGETRIFHKYMTEQYPKDVQKLMGLQPKQGLMIATPSHDGQCSLNYAMGLADLATFFTQQNIYFEMARVVGSSLLPHARNSLADMFLKSKCQRLLFVDADQGWTKEDVLMLFQSNRRLIAGVTPHKRFPINLNFDPLEQDKHYFKDLNNKGSVEFQKFAEERADKVSGEVEVSRTGTGFMMIDRSVFELMAPHVDDYYAFDQNSDDVHGEYFSMGPMGRRYRGEDWKFVELAKELHIPIFINTRCRLSHSGVFTWAVGQ